jgi:hypothetical protein
MEMTAAERQIEQSAVQWAKANRTALARQLSDPTVFVPEEHPVSVFMSGSPGAGKTETSKALLEMWSGTKVLRVDPDELRVHIPGYTGANAWLFQRAVTPIVERIHDLALQQKQSFVLDGTLSNFDVAARNIQRSLDKARTVQILYVYQEPAQAWRFVQAREAAEGRRIEPETFLHQYFASRNVVNRLKAQFGEHIDVDLLMKNNDGSNRFYRAGVDQIDNHIPEKYSATDIRRLIGLT